MTTKTLPDSTTATYTYNGSGVTLVNTGIQGAPGASGLNYGFVVAGNNDTLVNNGTIFGQRVGVYVTGSDDSVINAAGKKITATYPDQAGVNFYNFSGTLTNYGIISGYPASGILAGDAVELEHGGVVTNFGTLQNGGVLVGGAPGTVVNSGVILGDAAYGGVYMRFGGQVTNLAGGIISANGATTSYHGAPPYGVFIHGGAGTVINAGTINGSSGYAVELAAGVQNRLIVDPGAVFVGTVNGGTAIDATLELASSASTGTLSGIGTQIINFGTVTFDPSASWLVHTSTSASASVFTGFATNDTIDLAGFAAVSDTFSGNMLVLTNASTAHTTLHIAGTLTAANSALGSDGAGGTDLVYSTALPTLVYGQTLDQAGIVATTETVTAGVMALFNSGNTAVGTVSVGTTLATADFILRSDGSGGTDVIVDTIFGTYTGNVTLLTNPTTIASTGSIADSVAAESYGALTGKVFATVTNAGHVTSNRYGIYLRAGGLLTNSGSIYGASNGVKGEHITAILGVSSFTYNTATTTLVNSGSVRGTGYAVQLEYGGAVTNTNSGTINANSSGIGVNIRDLPGTVLNAGSIGGAGDINLTSGGYVSNASTGVLLTTNPSYGSAIQIGGGNATVINAGHITAAYAGIYSRGAGTLDIRNSGTIIGASAASDYSAGIWIYGATTRVTVENSGLISSAEGSGGEAITIAHPAALSLIVDPGAAFVGKVSAYTGVTNLIELTSGASTGTLSGLGTQFTNFGTVIFDPSASWLVHDTASAALFTGFAAGDTIDAASFVAVSETFASNTLVLTNASSAHATLRVQGAFTSGNFALSSDGAGGTDIVFGAIPELVYGQTLDQAGIVAATETVTAGIMTLFNSGATAVGTINVGTSLASGDFTLRSDGAGGTDVIVSSIFGTYAAGVTLLTNPTTIDATAIISSSAANAAGVYGSGGTAWTLVNLGLVTETGVGSEGISLLLPATINNYGTIAGVQVGLSLPNGGYATNQSGGTISGYDGFLSRNGSPGTMVNAGSIAGAGYTGTGIHGSGIYLVTGGLASNQPGGRITGFYGVDAQNDAATVVNAGSIGGNTTTAQRGIGVYLANGGAVTNQSGGTISGFYGVEVKHATATVVNAGYIYGDPNVYAGSAIGVYLVEGGSVTNQSSGIIAGYLAGVKASAGAATVVNLGTIITGGFAAQFGIDLADGGVIINGQSGGTRSSAFIGAYKGAIYSTSTNASTITNYGIVIGQPGGIAIEIATGTITNGPSGATGARIDGDSSGILIGGAGMVVNYGTVHGGGSRFGNPTYAVKLGGAGSIGNLGPNALIYGLVGVYAQSNDTVTNAGTIKTSDISSGVALVFGGGTNRLIVDPGAMFYGIVSGRGPVTLSTNGAVYTIGTANGVGSTTLELGSAASAGALAGFGTSIVNFDSLVFDDGAQWTVSGNDSASGFGTLGISGFTFGDTIDLTGFAAISQTFASNSLVLGDGGGNYATLAIQGTFATGNFRITNDGAGGVDIAEQPDLLYGQTLDQVGIVVASETITAGVMTLFNSGATAVGMINVGTSLASGDFTLASDGAGGTNVILDTVFGTYTNGVTLLTNLTTIASTANIIAPGRNALFGAGGSTGWTIDNFGVINGGTSAYGLQLGGNGSGGTGAGLITNEAGGTIAGRYGMRLYNSSAFSIVNLAGGTIAATAATSAKRAIDLEGAAGTVTNAGLISAKTFASFDVGVELDGGGTVINTATGTIAGGFGVLVSGAGTVVNAGTISGVFNNQFAVAISGGDRLVVDPGAVFIGAVNGGYGGGSSTLELASAASAGTLTATNFTHFSTIDFDAGAAWTLAGATTALSGAIVGFTFGDTIDLTGFAAVNSSFASNSLVLGNGAGGYDTLAIQGTFDSGNFRITNDGSGGTEISEQPYLLYGETLDEAGIIVASETVAAGVMTLFNSGATAVGTINVGTSLASGEFTLQSDGAGGTDVIVSTVFGTYTGELTLLTNPTTIASTASISGTVGGPGVFGPAGTAWVLTNNGTINDTAAGTNYGISFAGSGTITNAASGVIYGAGGGIFVRGAGATVTNLGQIEYARHGLGVVLDNGGTFTNGQAGGAASTASVSGYYYGVRVNSASTPGETGTVINFGTIDGPEGKGVSLVNGLLINGPNGATGALIDAYVGVCVTQLGTIVNYGAIANGGGGSGNYGILMVGGGTIANVGPASLIEGYTAIQAHASTTVTNAGSIVSSRGAGGVAIQFDVGTNLLVADPGAVFVGSLNAAGTATLELASGSSAGVLTGLGSSVTNFTSLVFDTGAQWTVVGDDSSGGLGTLAIGGFTFGDTIDLTGFAAISSTFASNALVLTNGGGAHETLAIQGTFVAGNFHLSSDGNAGTDIIFGAPPLLYGQTVDEAGIVATSETVTAGVMTLMNGASPVGTIVVGPTLSTGDFILRPDGASGTDVIVSSIFGTYTSSVTLVTNPTSIVGAASITDGVTAAVGVTGLSGTAWTLTNQGLISETGVGSEGISLASAGTITIQAGGVVDGNAVGIQLNAGGSVTNQLGGSINGVKGISVVSAAASIVNSGSIGGNLTSGSGIVINAGGSITNLVGGTISGSYGINASTVAVTVVNAGNIGDGTSLATGAAIALKHGGLIENQAGGQIIAGLQGMYIGGAAGTIFNAGTVGGGPSTGNGIIFAIGGAVTNQSGGVITGKYGVRALSGAVAVTNTGSIGGNLTSGGGVNLAAGGSLTNQSGGTITGQKAVLVTSSTVTNAGSIGGNTAIATGVGVQLSSGGSFTNQSGGVVTGFAGVFSNAAATLVNAGSIGGNLVTGRGVSLTGSGSVTNQAGGVITGFDGILAVGAATVVNAGSIGGTTAVSFGAGVTNRLVIDPGAVFTGTVNGGNTVGAAFISTMELASAASAGTLSGLGTQFINFAAGTIDTGANWTLSGTNAVVAGSTLINSGTLTDIGTLLNSGIITGNKLNLNGGLLNNQASGVLTATYVYGVAAGGNATVVNQGIITNTSVSAIYLTASGSVTNAVGGMIHGYGSAVKISGTAAAVTNLGQIVGASLSPSYGVYLRDGGVITNGQTGAGTSTASTRGYYGVTFKAADVVNAQGTLINYGTVIGTGTNASGVLLSNAGTVFNGRSGATAALIQGGRYGVASGRGLVANYATIIAIGTASGDYGVGIQTTGGIANLGTASLIEGHGGILIGTDGVVLNAGTIASSQGTSGVAVSFTGGNARLIDEPGAVFIGSINGGSGGTAELELASASSAGEISGLGGTVINFTSLVFDAGAQWTVAGNDSASGLGTMGISGFVSGDTIDLTSFVAVSRNFASNTLVLTDSIDAHETLHIQGGFATNNFRLTNDGAGGTDVTFVTPPTIVAGGTATFTGGGLPVTLDGSLTVTDPVGTSLAGGMVSLGTGFTTGDTLNFTAQNGISGSFSAGTLTLSGSATVADYQAALDSITYSFSPGNGDPTAGGGDTSRTIDWLLSDGTVVSDVGTSGLTTVHVAPTIIAGGTVTYAAGGTAAVLDATVTVSDPDSAGLLTGGAVAITGGAFIGDGDILSAITTGTSIILNYNAGTEILTLSGADTLADYQAVLGSVAFHSSASDPTNAADNSHRTISWTVGDGVSIATAGTSTLDITRLPPVISGSVAGQTTTDEATIDPFAGVSVADPNSGQTEAVRITLSNTANGTLSNLGGGTFNSGTYVVTGTTLAVTEAIEGLVFTPTAHQIAPGSTIATTFIIAVTDTNGVSVSDSTTTVIATAVNDAPVIAGAVAGQTVTDATTLSPLSGVSVSDVDFGQTETVTVTLSNHINGVLSNLGGGSYDSVTGVFSITGSDAAVTTAVDGLVFTPTEHQVAPGSSVTTTFTVGATDTAGGTSSNGTTTVGATAVADAPVIIGAVAGQTVTDEATVSPFSGVSISDVDVGQTETVTVTLSNHLNGALSNLGGGSYNGSTGVYSVIGSDAAVTTAVDGLVFTPTAHQVAPAASVTTTFTIGVTDTAGGTSSNSTTTVGATATNDAPVIAGAVAGQTVTDETTRSPFSGVSISDVDFGQSETVTVTLSSHLNGALSNLGGGSYNGSTGVYSVTGSDAAVTTAVDGLVFTPTAHQVAPGSSVTTTFTIHAINTAEGTSSNSTTTVGATAVNGAPVIAGAVAGQTVTDETTLSPLSGVSISDVDVGQTETVTVTLSNHLNGALSNLGGGSYDGTIGVYSVTGSDAAVTTAVDGLVFAPTAHQVAPGSSVTTTFTVGVTDTAGGTTSNTTTTVVATAVNDAPVISGAVGGQTVSDEETLSPLSGVSISDVDFGQTEMVTVTLSNHLNGVLSNLGGGSYDESTGVYSVTGGDAAVTTAIDGLVFTPTAHQVAPGGPVATTFTIQATDTAGGTSSNATTNATATAVNDAPVIAGATAGQTVTDETTLSPFVAVSIGDVDFGQTENLTVTLSNNLNGVLSNLGDGSYDSATGVYSVTGTDAAVTTAVDGLVFTPTIHQVPPGSSVTTTFTIQTTDTAEGTSSDSTTTVVATAVNDPPTITLPTVNAGVPNQTEDTPFAGVTIADPDVGHIDTVTVTLSDAAGGALSNLGGGSYDPMSGVYTVTGSPDAVTTALQGLVFTPAPPSNGFVSTTGFTVAVTGSGGTATNSSISVTSAQQVLGLAGVPTGNDVISVSPDGSSFAAPTPGQTNQAVVSNPASGGSYTLPTGYQAAFLGGSADASLSDPTGGNALLVGNSGNDTLMSGAANDTILGGSGQSTIQFTSGASGGVAFGGTGNATFMDAGNADTLAGAAGTTAATISGSSGVFFSLTGTVTLLASGGNSTLVGGSGQSTFQLTSSATNAVVFGAAGSVVISDAGTGDTLAGAAGPTSVTTSGSNAVFFGQAGDTSLLDSGLSNTIIGGSGPTTYQLTSGATDAVVLGGSGGFSLVDAGVGTTIAGGGGTTTSTLAGANAVFFSQSGDTTVLDTGGNNTLVGGSGQSSFRVGSGAAGALVLGGAGSVSIQDAGNGDTLAGAAGPTAVTMSGSNGLFFGQGGDVSVLDTGLNNTVVGGAGQTAITASGAGAHVFGGSGSLSFIGGTSGATILGGSGDASITGGSAGTTLFGSNGGAIDYTGAAGSLFYVAGGGNETLDAAAATTNNQMFGSLDARGRDLIVGGSGNDTMAAGSGNDTVVGGTSSHDLFVFFSVNGGADDVVENFTANDTVLLAGYGGAAAADALSHATFGGGSTTITLSDNTQITFRDISSITGLTGHLLSN